MSLLKLNALCKSFGSIVVADAISVTVGPGEAVGIIGPNGAGKSTLFNMIAGDLQPDAGSIELFGRNVTRFSTARRCRLGVGRSFQIPQPFDQLSVFENLLVAATFGRGSSERSMYAPCKDILKRSGLIDKANREAGSLGLLDRKRLELARALATGPKLLLLDEIAGGLTDGECGQLIELITDIRKSDVTIVWIEHVIHALTAVVDRMIVLDAGCVVEEGKPDDVLNSQKVKEAYLGMEV